MSAKALGHVLSSMPAFVVVGKQAEREDGKVARGDDEYAEPRPPDLDE
jgi:hypothetical protein